jgi:hypothetical protein
MDVAQLIAGVVTLVIAVTALVAAMTACAVQIQAILGEVRAMRVEFNGRMTEALGVTHAAGVAEGKLAGPDALPRQTP